MISVHSGEGSPIFNWRARYKVAGEKIAEVNGSTVPNSVHSAASIPSSSSNSRRAAVNGCSSGSIPPLTTSTLSRSTAYRYSLVKYTIPLSSSASTDTPGRIVTVAKISGSPSGLTTWSSLTSIQAFLYRCNVSPTDQRPFIFVMHTTFHLRFEWPLLRVPLPDEEANH